MSKEDYLRSQGILRQDFAMKIEDDSALPLPSRELDLESYGRMTRDFTTDFEVRYWIGLNFLPLFSLFVFDDW